MPVGSELDTVRGRVRLTLASGSKGKTTQILLYAGRFKVTQSASSSAYTDFTLEGPVGPCPKRGAAATAKQSTRRLWGSGKGRNRSRGRYGDGGVNGTIWLTEDSCAGTLFVVKQGTVTVRDFGLRKTIVLRAGKRYLARRP